MNVPLNTHGMCIEVTPITRVVSTKFLGMYIDQHLTWKEYMGHSMPVQQMVPA